MIGATPATSTRSLCTTPSAMPCGAAGVDRIAARLRIVKAGRRGEVMAGRDRVAGDGDGWTMRGGCGHGETLARSVAGGRIAPDESPTE